MSKNQLFNIRGNELKSNERSSKSKQQLTGIIEGLTSPEADARKVLNNLSEQVQILKDNNIQAKKRPKFDAIIPVKTENTYFSSFAPTSAVPFQKEVIITNLDGGADPTVPGNTIFDFFEVPDKRVLFLTSLVCRITTGGNLNYQRFTLFSNDDEFASYGFGYSLIANKTNSTFLAQEYLNTNFAATPLDLFGSYYTFNQNVLASGSVTPAYLTYPENLNVRVQFAWRYFPTGLATDPLITNYTAIVKASGFLLNLNEYYRFVDASRSTDVSEVEYSKKP
jgi:hypothetical protein